MPLYAAIRFSKVRKKLYVISDSSKITMDIYAHVNMDAKRKAMAAVSKVF